MKPAENPVAFAKAWIEAERLQKAAMEMVRRLLYGSHIRNPKPTLRPSRRTP